MSAIRILFLVFSVIYLTALYRILGSQFNISTIEQKYNHAKTYIYLSENASESVNLPTVFPATVIPPTPMNPSVPSTQSSELNSSLPSISESTPLPPVSSTLPVSNAPISTTNETYMLVLFTTEVVLTKKVRNTLKMMALFQQEFSCRSIVFTTTPSILELCTTLGLTTSYDIQENPYGIPYIGSLFQRAASLFDAHFYGYINADILLSPKIFSILPFIMEHKRQNFPTRMFELCHNSFNTAVPDFKDPLTLATYEHALDKLMNRNYGQRPASSVDVFILTPEFRNMTFEDIVIARSYVDAYMIYWGTYKGVVIDMADQIVTIHQGRDRYSNRADSREGNDYNWNKLVMKRRFGTLANARFMLSEKGGKLEIERKHYIRYAKKKGK